MLKFILLTVLVSAQVTFATSPARILTSDSNGVFTVLGLSEAGSVVVLKGKADARFISIKDFREGAEFSEPCYTGSVTDAEVLLTELVSAANGDGDSYAELVSITGISPVEVVVNISDESGENEETFSFKACPTTK